MSKSKFYDKIKTATEERHVEDVFYEGLRKYYKDCLIANPHKCDGYLYDEENKLGLLMEFKYDILMKNPVQRAKVLGQTLVYLKRFLDNGDRLPNIILIGDINECFVMHTNELQKYLDYDIDWKKAASNIAATAPDLIIDIANDPEINPFVWDIDEKFSFKEVVDKINSLSKNVQRLVPMTEHNIANIFDYFTKNVLVKAKKISANDIVAIFLGAITDNENYYVHPKKSNKLITPFGEIDIDGKAYLSFFKHFNKQYSPKEKMKFAEISDRLIEDTNRRNKGEFYTPVPFVDYAHKMISEALGDDWKDEYVVWDNCCGTKNLTRDYRFKELYCSTLENAELDISQRYNPEATSFQFDFLNDPLEKLPNGLLEAFEQNKKIVFFLNPPYAGTNSGENQKGAKGLCLTYINSEMKKNNMGACSQNLYAQFIYRLISIKEKYNLTNCTIGIFCPTLFLTGPSWQKFRNYLFNNFNLNDAIQFNAGHFSNVSSSWGISFSFWKNGKQNNVNEFNYKIIDNIDGDIKIIQNKILYNLDNLTPLIDYSRNKIKGEKYIEQPNLRTGITWSEYTITGINGLGYFYNKCNNIGTSGMHCSIWTSAYNGGHGYGISKNNFNEVCLTYSARKLIEKTWINSKDEYLAPNESHPKFQEFVNDSIVYSLFNTSSNQSSLRQIKYHDKLWDIKNEFFWMSKSEIESLANEYNNDACYSDVHTSDERFVYKKLQEITLTPEARAVLDKACEIVRKTFKYRPLFDSEHPEYQINNWDCGWYQIKALAKEYAKDDLDEFKQLYKALSDKMRPMVYELGFLK